MTVAGVKAATGADMLLGFDATDLYHTRILSDTAHLVPGQGVWVRVPAAVTWTVAGW